MSLDVIPIIPVPVVPAAAGTDGCYVGDYYVGDGAVPMDVGGVPMMANVNADSRDETLSAADPIVYDHVMSILGEDDDPFASESGPALTMLDDVDVVDDDIVRTYNIFGKKYTRDMIRSEVNQFFMQAFDKVRPERRDALNHLATLDDEQRFAYYLDMEAKAEAARMAVRMGDDSAAPSISSSSAAAPPPALPTSPPANAGGLDDDDDDEQRTPSPLPKIPRRAVPPPAEPAFRRFKISNFYPTIPPV
jgi:hypothetical protein